MNTITRIGLCVLIAGYLFGCAGCGKKADTSVSAEKPIADVQAEAAKMDAEQLKTKAMEYKNAIVAKKAEIETVVAKLKAIPITQQLGDEAKGLQTDMANLSKSLSSLTERFQVYYNKLKESGGSIEGLGI